MPPQGRPTTQNNSSPSGPRSTSRTSSTDKIYAPIPAAKSFTGNNWHEQRSYEVHQGMDIPCPVGSVCVAPVRGKIRLFTPTGFGKEGGMIQLEVADADNNARDDADQKQAYQERTHLMLDTVEDAAHRRLLLGGREGHEEAVDTALLKHP